jgi:hypothetical protein
MQTEVTNLISGTKLAAAEVRVRGGPDSDEYSEWLGSRTLIYHMCCGFRFAF